MNKEEIKKALECCQDNSFDACCKCPYHTIGNHISVLCKDALALITEQEKEIEKQNSRVKCLKTRLANKMVLLANVEDLYESETKKLKEEKQELATALKQAEDNYSRAFERLKAQQQEIDALKAENERLAKVVSAKVYDFIGNVKEIADAREAWEQQAQIDVLTKLEEKIQNAIDTYWNSNGGGYYLAEDAIDEIDEMIEEIKK